MMNELKPAIDGYQELTGKPMEEVKRIAETLSRLLAHFQNKGKQYAAHGLPIPPHADFIKAAAQIFHSTEADEDLESVVCLMEEYFTRGWKGGLS